MSTRKPKLPEMYPVDDPAKQLQLITVGSDTGKKVAATYSRARQADESALHARTTREKKRLH